MPKSKEEIFDMPQPVPSVEPTQDPPKKRRKRKPMTEEQKKAFSEKMKAAKLKKAQQLAEQIVENRSNTSQPKPKASKPKSDISVPMVDNVNSQVRANNMISVDSKHFENLSTHIQQLNANILNLQNYRSQQKPKPQEKPLSPVKEEPQEKQPNIEMKVEVEKKPQEKKVTIEEPKQPPPNYASAKPERRKVYNVRTKKYVYV